MHTHATLTHPGSHEQQPWPVSQVRLLQQRGSGFLSAQQETEPGLPAASSPAPVTSGHVVPGPVTLCSDGLHLSALHQRTGLSLQQGIWASALLVPSRPS